MIMNIIDIICVVVLTLSWVPLIIYTIIRAVESSKNLKILRSKRVINDLIRRVSEELDWLNDSDDATLLSILLNLDADRKAYEENKHLKFDINSTLYNLGLIGFSPRYKNFLIAGHDTVSMWVNGDINGYHISERESAVRKKYNITNDYELERYSDHWLVKHRENKRATFRVPRAKNTYIEIGKGTYEQYENAILTCAELILDIREQARLERGSK